MNSATKVAIVGAGLCGLKCAHDLKNQGISVTVFEKSRGIGGRIANRRTKDGLAFDHGAQYVTAKNESFKRYVSLVIEKSYAATWVFYDLNVSISKKSRIVGIEGMSDLVRPLSKGLEICFETEVKSIRKNDQKWRLLFRGKNAEKDFDIVVIAIPAPQAIMLIEESKDLSLKLKNVDMSPCLAAMLTFSEKVETPYDTISSNNGVLAWAARDSCKPGRDQTLDSWVLHANPEWSAKWLEADRDKIAKKLTQAFASKIKKPLPGVVYSVGHRWRYALTKKPLGKDYVVSEDKTLFIGGDWCIGARAECAFESGEAISSRIVSA